MLDITSGQLKFKIEKMFQVHPFLTKKEFESMDWDITPSSISKTTLFLPNICVGGYNMGMEVHFDRNEHIDRITLRSTKTNGIEQAKNNVEMEQYLKAIKEEHDALLSEICHLPIDQNSHSKEVHFDASWGSVSSILDCSETPDARIVIRFRNIQEGDKNRYLKLGKERLYGRK